jgi:mRNA interferase RelE/StbE
MYELLFSQIVQKQQKNIRRKDLEKIKTILLELKENPRPHHCKKLSGSNQSYRIRFRYWRILYEIDDHKHIVTIYGILHRKEAYR